MHLKRQLNKTYKCPSWRQSNRFFFLTLSVCVVYACHAAASERDPEKKEKNSSRVIACKHIWRSIVSQSPWTDDSIPDGLYVRLRCNASCTTERRACRSISLLRGIHSTREIAPPRTKRNGPRRFYYMALKPGRLPLQSYRSKLVAPLQRIVDRSKNSTLSLWD